MAALDFWYDFASTYSYLSAARIANEAKDAGVEVRWKPFLLGPIFHAQGWDNSPFNIYPAKGRYMRRDMERICAARKVAFGMPRPFPQNGLYAARLAVIGAAEGWVEPFSRAVFRAEFADGAQIDDRAVLAACLTAAGQNPETQFPRIEADGIKALLKAQTAQAQALGVFGAPAFVTEDAELFWGDDRLEEALQWAKASGDSKTQDPAQPEQARQDGDTQAPRGDEETPRSPRAEAPETSPAQGGPEQAAGKEAP